MAASDHEDGRYALEEEIELLEAIYIHELTVDGPRERPSSVSVLLHPSTGDEEHKQFVCLTLVVSFPDEYPSVLPSISIKSPRGLSDANIESIVFNLRKLAESCLGGPMLYELFECAKESLTDNNVPSCTCAICLCHFQDGHEFTKTACYHYFHCGCLARYIEFSQRQGNKIDNSAELRKVECPMCRLPITYDQLELRKFASDELNDDKIIYEPTEDVKKMQKEMSLLFEKQKRKGGIIDVELERNKFLIDITTARQGNSTLASILPSRTEAGVQKRDFSTTAPSYHGPKKGSRELLDGSHKDKPDKKRSEYTKNARSLRGSQRPPSGPSSDGRGNQAAGDRSTIAESRRKETPTLEKIDRRKAFEWNRIESPGFEKSRRSKPPVMTKDCSDDKKRDEKLDNTPCALKSGESKDDGAATRRTHDEQPRSARRSRGKGKRALGNKIGSQQNTQDSTKAFDCRMVEPQTEKTKQAEQGIKNPSKESDCKIAEPQCENSKGSVIKNDYIPDCRSEWQSSKRSTSGEGRDDERDKSVRPPPGFEVITRHKAEPVRFKNVTQPPPGFEKQISFSRPLP